MWLSAALSLVVSFSDAAAAQPKLWLSDSSLTLGPVAMHFPPTQPDIAPDGSAAYRGVFDGIDLHVYRNARNYEYDWIVAPGADPSKIRMSFTGASARWIVRNGDLILIAHAGEVRHTKPFAYQEIDGVKHEVPAQFELAANGGAGFRLGPYDRTKPLVIDPTLTFATGIGGSGAPWQSFGKPIHLYDSVTGAASDASGNIYITGLAVSKDFPLTVPSVFAACPLPPEQNVFAARISPDGNTLIYSTLLAACVSGAAPSIAADALGNVYIAFGTSIMKLDANGAVIATWASPGSITSLQFGPDQNLYIAGTALSGFPVTAGALNSTAAGTLVFLTKLNPALLSASRPLLNAVLYSALLGPGAGPVFSADVTGSVYLATSTQSDSWATTPGVFQPQCAGSCNNIVAVKVSPDGTRFDYATYLGGSQVDTATGIAVDGSGNAFIAGNTNSPDFPTTTGAVAKASNSNTGAFAAKLSGDGSHLMYSTLLSQAGGLTATAVTSDSSGNVWVGGIATQTGLPTQTGIQQSLFNSICGHYNYPTIEFPTDIGYCAQAAYVAEVNPSGSALLWATYLGGGVTNQVCLDCLAPTPALNSLLLDNSGSLFAAGSLLAMRNTMPPQSISNSASILKIALAGASFGDVAVQSAAGFAPGLPEPGGLAALYFDGAVGTGTTLAPGLPLPTQLAGVEIFVDGVAAPLVSVSAIPGPITQVNFQAPTQLPQPQSHVVEVRWGGQSAFLAPQQTAPGIFTLADGSGAIQHAADYSLVTTRNPIVRGETIVVYATGLGPVMNPVASGAATTGPDPIVITGCNQLTSNAGTVLYAGLTPGFPGLYQVNIQVSQTLASGANSFYLNSQSCWADMLPVSFRSNSVTVMLQ